MAILKLVDFIGVWCLLRDHEIPTAIIKLVRTKKCEHEEGHVTTKKVSRVCPRSTLLCDREESDRDHDELFYHVLYLFILYSDAR